MGMLLLVIPVVAAIYWFAREAKSKPKSLLGETPLDILKKRYARGEITMDEFDRIKKDLDA